MRDRETDPVPSESTDAECRRLREENARLRQLLTEHKIPLPQTEPAMPPRVEAFSADDRQEQARKRIALFRSLFRGREESTRDDGKAPTEGRDTHRRARGTGKINSSKPEDRKKVDQRTRRFFPVTDSAIENHLLGKETIGI